MCGIAGIWEPGLKKNERGKIARAMLEEIRYRGPDGTGVHEDDEVTLGNVRLSIIDIEGGNQPFYNETGDIACVFNGEIYNYRTLREYLIGKGHIFRTSCDTEIIPHMWEEFEGSMFELLDGQFAIALWIGKSKSLILARDHNGIRPLYYYEDKGKLIFASELRALKKYPGQFSFDERSFSSYLALGYIAGERSIFKEIKKIPPATYAVFKNGRESKRETFWNIECGSAKRCDLARIDELMRESVRKRLISDAPLGLLLSGGLDSSIIAYYVKEMGTDMTTYTVAFPEKGFNESGDAARVAALLGLKNERIEITSGDILDTIRNFDGFDEPFADSAFLNVYLITKFTSGKVKVLLSGEGGDETFGGYHTYTATALNHYLSRMPPFFRSVIDIFARSIKVQNRTLSMSYKIKKFSEASGNDVLLSHLLWKGFFSPSQVREIFPGIEPVTSLRNMYNIPSSEGDISSTLNKAMFLDRTLYLPDDLLVKIDRASMLNSIEGRMPFLDKELASYMFSLGGSLKADLFKTKKILKKIASGRLPASIINKTKKGFSLPLALWMEKELYGHMRAFFMNSGTAAAFVNREGIDRLLNEHKARAKDNSRLIWALYVFFLWGQKNGL